MATPFVSSSSNSQQRKTTSTCTTETIQGTHLFHISGYSKTKGLGVKFIRSGTFNVGGYDWAIRYYPDGSGKDNKDHLSVFVELMSKNTEARAFFELRLVDKITELSCAVQPEDKKLHVFKDPDSPTWGYDKFKKRSELEASTYVRDDCLTVECIITVVKGPPHVSDNKFLPEIEVPPSDILEHFGKLLKGQEGADLTFIIQGEKFLAHKMVLVRSPVFKAELHGPTWEKRMRHITIDDMQPAVFRTLLHFIYTDSLPTMMDNIDKNDSKEIIPDLLAAADRYAMERLKLMCEHFLSKSLDVETVATTMALANRHDCEKLKEACVEFMASSGRMEDVVASTGYQHLKRTCPSLLVDVWEKRVCIRRSQCAHVEISLF